MNNQEYEIERCEKCRKLHSDKPDDQCETCVYSWVLKLKQVSMDDTKLVDLMNQLIELTKDAQKLTNDFAALATQVAAIVCEKQKSDT